MAQLLRHAAFTSQPSVPRRKHVAANLGGLRCYRASTPRLLCFATAPNQPAPKEAAPAEEDFVGVPPEEDVEVPGNYFDAMDPKTKLGKAVRAAVDELNHLNAMEMESLKQCDSLLKKLGVKNSIMQAPAQPQEPSEQDS